MTAKRRHTCPTRATLPLDWIVRYVISPTSTGKRVLVVNRGAADRPRSAKLYICGTGARIPGHLTVETMGVLQSCSRIFSRLSPYARELLPATLALKCEEIDDQLPVGGQLPVDWSVVASRILDAASDSSPVAYLMMGSPVVFDPLSKALVSGAREREIHVDVRPAISAIDAVLTDLQLDLLGGVQVFDMAAFVMCSMQPRLDMPCLLIPLSHGGTVTLRDHYGLPTVTSRLLHDHLLRFYAAEHPAFAVRPTPELGRTAIDAVTIGELAQSIDGMELDVTSICIPAVASGEDGRWRAAGRFVQEFWSPPIRKPEFQA